MTVWKPLWRVVAGPQPCLWLWASASVPAPTCGVCTAWQTWGFSGPPYSRPGNRVGPCSMSSSCKIYVLPRLLETVAHRGFNMDRADCVGIAIGALHSARGILRGLRGRSSCTDHDIMSCVYATCCNMQNPGEPSKLLKFLWIYASIILSAFRVVSLLCYL